MKTWFERVRTMILEAPSPVLIEADAAFGIPQVVSSLRSPDEPLIWLDLGDVDCTDKRAIGDSISEAVRRGLGSALFGLGVDEEYALASLASYLPSLAPLTVAVTFGERRSDLVNRLVRISESPNRLIVHTSGRVSQIHGIGDFHIITAEPLALTVSEAVDLFGGDRDQTEIERAVRVTHGALVEVEDELMLRDVRSDGSARQGDRSAGVTSHGANGVVDALIARRRWVEAFEFAVDQMPTRIRDVLDEAGNAYFELGQFERFWTYLSGAPRWALREEQSMYWMFNAAVAVNRWRPLLPKVDRYLSLHEAPDLRAIRATAEVNDRSLAEARRAHDAKETPETARALAFLEEFCGELGAAERLYREAIDLAEAASRPRHVVSAAVGLAQVCLFEGAYERAQHWGAWSVERYRAYGLREELLRLSAMSACAYPKLLVGAVHSAGQVLEEVRIQDGMIGIPMVEAVISTLGDLALAEGRYLDAISQYKMNLESASRAMYPALANDLVRGLLIGGEIAEAEVVASEAYELCSLAPSHQQGLAEIALGCVLAHKADGGGEQLLRAAIETLRALPLGVQAAQAAIHLAKFLLRQGRLEEARALLEENSRFIAELGDSGWLLLGGEGPEIAQLKRMFRSGEPELELRLLGKRCLRVRDAETTLSMRVAELLAVLAAHPNGIGGEQLADALYGDRANASTLKAMVSRARRQLPIEAKPYRVADSYQADFMQVLELLHIGKVQAALELYRGPLLPESDAPAVVELREHLEESMRQAVLASGDADAMIDLANQQGDDLELWEETRRNLPPNDPRRPLANARIRRIRKRWQAEAR